LGRLGLVAWSEASIEFPEETESLFQEGFSEVLDLVPNHRRLVPVPRRILRRIAQGERKTGIATILGHLLRCLYYKGGLCLPEGTCKASWIADVFGVDVRNVKSARKELVEIGWLVPIATKQVHLNRFGARFRVNLEWSSRNDISPLPKRSLPRPKTTTGLPPLYKDKKLSTRNEKPETRRSGPAGVFQKPGPERAQLRNVRMEDLDSTPSLCELFAQAVEKGLVKRSEMDRLNFFAAAEHARAVGTKNPCGLFVTIVRRGLWQYISLSDEDAARAKLRRLSETGELQELPGCQRELDAPKKVRLSVTPQRSHGPAGWCRMLSMPESAPMSWSHSGNPLAGSGHKAVQRLQHETSEMLVPATLAKGGQAPSPSTSLMISAGGPPFSFVLGDVARRAGCPKR